MASHLKKKRKLPTAFEFGAAGGLLVGTAKGLSAQRPVLINSRFGRPIMARLPAPRKLGKAAIAVGGITALAGLFPLIKKVTERKGIGGKISTGFTEELKRSFGFVGATLVGALGGRVAVRGALKLRKVTKARAAARVVKRTDGSKIRFVRIRGRIVPIGKRR